MDNRGLGLARGHVAVVPYSASWPQQFNQERQRLLAACAGLDVRIEHIGSTAIPGMPAKPILDINLGVTDPSHIAQLIPLLASSGYSYMPERVFADRIFLPKGPEAGRTHHLNIVTIDCPSGWAVPIQFRDYLRANKHVARQYAELKLALAAKYSHDRAGYTKGKEDFILQILRAVD